MCRSRAMRSRSPGAGICAPCRDRGAPRPASSSASDVSRSPIGEARAEVGDRLVAREQDAILGEERVHERLRTAPRPVFGTRPLHQQRMDVHAVGVERDVGLTGERVIDRDEQGSISDLAQTRSCDRLPPSSAARIEPIALELGHQGVEGGGETRRPGRREQEASWDG